ncbi:hypothetical protein Ndes2526B_g07199 [Nannochloris sp. 'desiccata']
MWDFNEAHSLFLQTLRSQAPKNISRRLAAVSGTLLRDILAVASGLRPSFLLDYLVIDSERLVSIISTGLDLLPQQLLETQQLCVLALDNCCLVTNLKIFHEGQSFPLFIEFEDNIGGGGMTVRWANSSEEAAMQNNLFALRYAVLAQLPPLLATRVPIIDLDAISRTLEVTMPTLNGWLLGYPVCYAVHDMANAESASRCLCTTTLKLYSVFTKLEKILASKESKDAVVSPLFAFSVPMQLVESDRWQERKHQWEETLRKRHNKAIAVGILLKNLIIEETTCMRGIAL